MKTVILAGGLGTRLSEETVVKPKPMVEVGGMPILWHIMKTYSSYGHNEFMVALGYKGGFIKDFFINYKTYRSDVILDLKSGNVTLEDSRTEIEDWRIHLCETGKESMTGGRLLRLKPYFDKDETFMLTYGDGVSDIDIDKLIDFHQKHGKIATLTAVRPPARFGAIITDETGKIKEFKEKPQIGEGWINGGYFVFNAKIFDYLQQGDATILEQDPLEKLTADGELMAYRHDGYWQCMDTIRDKDVLNDLWNKGKATWKKW